MRTALLVCAVLAGCASTTPVAVKPATPAQVASCAYLDDVIGTSGWYGLMASQGAENARAEAINRAAQLGATHLVWSEPSVRYGSTSTSAKAYRCA